VTGAGRDRDGAELSRARLRLAALFSGLAVLAGAILLAVVNVAAGGDLAPGGEVGDAVIALPCEPGQTCRAVPEAAAVVLINEGADEARRRVRLASGAGLVGLAVASAGVGWWLAGRVLRPVGRAFATERQLVATLSHELRTPLATQRTVLEVAGDGPADGLRAAVDVALAQNARAERIVEAMLALARIRRLPRGTATAIALAEVVRATAERVTAGSDLTLDLDAGPVTLAGEPTLIEQLVENLVTNAVVHNIPAGRIWIAVTPSPPTLTVANTGPVLDPATVARLVLPFERGQAVRTGSAGGSGLGLAIARDLVRLMGGVFDVVIDGDLFKAVLAFPPAGKPGQIPRSPQ